MARSHAIYLIRKGSEPISAHTVKHEAHTWLTRTCWTPKDCALYRVLDGLTMDGENCKLFTRLEWEDRLFFSGEWCPGGLKSLDAPRNHWPEWMADIWRGWKND